jgi:hypothetical protein
MDHGHEEELMPVIYGNHFTLMLVQNKLRRKLPQLGLLCCLSGGETPGVGWEQGQPLSLLEQFWEAASCRVLS